ncbi:hypothetical protein V6N12_065937 [Hibiscus sabdariffa]|uniref:Uncharacterized protein n=1 Tax=Hibiscus sabdariffa TaxID=183260 RepID=A0ABR2BEE3_9ROSI
MGSSHQAHSPGSTTQAYTWAQPSPARPDPPQGSYPCSLGLPTPLEMATTKAQRWPRATHMVASTTTTSD